MDAWRIVEGPLPLKVPAGSGWVWWLWKLEQGERRRYVEVRITRTAQATNLSELPRPVAEVVEHHGLAAVVAVAGWAEPPRRIEVTTTRIILVGGQPQASG